MSLVIQFFKLIIIAYVHQKYTVQIGILNILPRFGKMFYRIKKEKPSGLLFSKVRKLIRSKYIVIHLILFVLHKRNTRIIIKKSLWALCLKRVSVSMFTLLNLVCSFMAVMKSMKNIPIILLELEGAWKRTVTSMLVSTGVKEN